MAVELVAGTSQLRLMPLNTQCSEQLRTGSARELLQLTTQGRGALVIGNIRNGHPGGIIMMQSPILKAASSRKRACRFEYREAARGLHQRLKRVPGMTSGTPLPQGEPTVNSFYPLKYNDFRFTKSAVPLRDTRLAAGRKSWLC